MANITELATGYPGYNARQPMDRASIGAMLRTQGYNTFCVGKWHNTPAEEVGPAGPFDRWPTGPLFGFDRFYGFMGGDSDQWYPKLFSDCTPIDQPATPDEGYHLSEDLVDRSIGYIASNESVDPDKPWLLYLAFGACHAPHHAPSEWIDKYRGRFDMGWDAYRETVLARQKEAGIVPQTAALSPMLEGIPAWDDLDADRKRLFARMAEVYAGFLAHTDHQVGRLIELIEETGDLDNTLVFVFIGDNGSSGEGTIDGLFNEMSLAAYVPESLEFKLDRIDQLGGPGSYNHYPVGWAMAGNTPFKLCKQYVHFGGIRNPLVVHWPDGFAARGELRNQFHHAIDVVPTILAAAGLEPPHELNSVQQAPIEGVPMNYTFDDGSAKGRHVTQYNEVTGNRSIYHDGWLAAVVHRAPWEHAPRHDNFDDDEWELYHMDEDFGLATNLAAQYPDKVEEMKALFHQEAVKYNVLPLDDRSFQRLNPVIAGRPDLIFGRTVLTLYPGMKGMTENGFINTKAVSYTIDADLTVPEGGADTRRLLPGLQGLRPLGQRLHRHHQQNRSQNQTGSRGGRELVSAIRCLGNCAVRHVILHSSVKEAVPLRFVGPHPRLGWNLRLGLGQHRLYWWQHG